MALDFRTMEPEFKMPRKKLKKEIFIIKGDLDEKRLKEIPEVEIIIVTGNTNFTKKYVYIPAMLVVLGTCQAKQINARDGLLALHMV